MGVNRSKSKKYEHTELSKNVETFCVDGKASIMQNIQQISEQINATCPKMQFFYIS